MRALRAELEQGLIASVPELAEPGDVADTVMAAIAARWPVDWVDGGAFAHYLARRTDPALAAATAVGELWIADLYLACATIAGVRAAQLAFDRIVATELPPALRTVEANADVIDDVLQLLRAKLLVPVDGVARLEAYSGHGPLAGWLRVSALRIALSLKRRRQPQPLEHDELAQILDLAPNAEVKVLAAQAGADLRAALHAAMAALPARTRAVLRMYYVDGHGVEAIGRVYNVHASSVSRWLAKARADILAHTRAELVTRLPASQVDSLLGHAASVEISLASLLRSAPA